MKHLFAATLFTSLGLTLGLSTLAEARPYPDRSGVCYFYRGETQEILESCVIASGYGAGATYAVLNWSDGVQTVINSINFCPDENYDAAGFCGYTVDESPAEPYERNASLEVTTIPDTENLICYRVIESDNSVCYRFDE